MKDFSYENLSIHSWHSWKNSQELGVGKRDAMAYKAGKTKDAHTPTLLFTNSLFIALQ